MSVVSLRLPDYLHDAIRELAQREKVTINQFLTLAAAEKVSALMTEDYLAERARRGDRAAFEGALGNVPAAEPEPADAIRRDRVWPDRIREEGPSYAASRPPFDVVWERILQHQGEEFRQRRGGAFTYEVRGDVLMPDRTATGIARSQFEQAYEFVPLAKVSEVPARLWGPSYIFAILMDERIRAGDW
jgi:hypothetical protein